MTEMAPPPPASWWQRYSGVPVWVFALAAVVFTAMFARDQYLVWLPIAMGAAVILSFAIQLGIQRKEGYVTRVMLSIAGAFFILAVATGVLALLP